MLKIKIILIMNVNDLMAFPQEIIVTREED